MLVLPKYTNPLTDRTVVSIVNWETIKGYTFPIVRNLDGDTVSLYTLLRSTNLQEVSAAKRSYYKIHAH